MAKSSRFIFFSLVVMVVVCNIAGLFSASFSNSLADSRSKIQESERTTSLSSFVNNKLAKVSPKASTTAEQYFSELIQGQTSTTEPTQRPCPDSQLVSSGKPVTSSVRGNLASAQAITDEAVDDWLTDRWQAAKNMQGEPIPGIHWVEIDLLSEVVVCKVLIDWETASSADWVVESRLCNSCDWSVVSDTTDPKAISEVQSREQHVLQVSFAPPMWNTRSRHLRLTIRGLATQWGASIWRFQVWGRHYAPERLVTI